MDPTLSLLIACCRQVYEGGDLQVLREQLRRADGPRLAILAQRHRVEALTWRALREAGILLSGTESLHRSAHATAADNLLMAAECARIHRTLAATSLPHLFLKGLPLGAVAWGDPMLKRQSDIDLLVLPTAIGKVARLLSQLGYVQQIPDPSVDASDWHRRHKESLWRNDDGLLLDLHSRVADHAALLPQVAATVTPDWVEVAQGVSLPTLPRPLLLPYLAVHGASSAWFRLKWLADFAAVVHRTAPEIVAQAADSAPRIGAGRTLSAALVLSHQLFGTALSDDLWFDPGARRMVRLALAHLDDAREPTERRFGTLGIHWSQLLMVPGRRFVLSELGRQASSAIIG